MLSKEDLMNTLSHVLWIGGAPDAGKTTVAQSLCDKHGLLYYSLGEHAEEHWLNHVSKDPTSFGYQVMQLSLDEKGPWRSLQPVGTI
jgi:broad-specificity NMP kinase